MAGDRAGKAADVVLEDEAVDEAAALLGEDGDVPGGGNDEEEGEGAPVKNRSHPDLEVLPENAKNKCDRQRNEDSDRPFCQHAESDRRVRGIEPLPLAG